MEGKQESIMMIECQFATSCAAWLVRNDLRSVNVRFRYPKVAVFRWHSAPQIRNAFAERELQTDSQLGTLSSSENVRQVQRS